MARCGAWRHYPIREKFRRRTIRPQRRSGLTVRAFCLGEGLKDGTFHWRRHALACRDRAPAALPPRHRDGEPTAATPASPPARLVDLEPVRPRRSPSIEMLLPTDPTVRVPSGCNSRTLGQVLAVPEGRPC